MTSLLKVIQFLRAILEFQGKQYKEDDRLISDTYWCGLDTGIANYLYILHCQRKEDDYICSPEMCPNIRNTDRNENRRKQIHMAVQQNVH